MSQNQALKFARLAGEGKLLPGAGQKIYEQKKLLRLQILRGLKSLSPGGRAAAEASLARQFCAQVAFQQARRVGLFASLPLEVATDFLITESLQRQKEVFLPRVAGGVLIFHQIKSLTELVVNSKGIREPVATQPVLAAAKLDLLLVPGLAFDQAQNRLGFGQGFYDRVLQNFASPTISLAFDFQILPQLPVTRFDQKVQKILVAQTN